ncbi:MAG: glycosyltransferase family 2 protein [Thiotrichales bacterium]|nr:glycosyltransferase family 2 protein [Thiotrichales bacterium]
MSTTSLSRPLRIAAVIPCYRGRDSVLDVIHNIPDIVTRIYCIDDACTEGTGQWIEQECRDDRVKVIRHEANRGVGGAMVTGYQAALDDNMDIVVKLDSDGQMDPALIPVFVQPILNGQADYTKGNRFFRLEDLSSMPKIRLLGNAILSFMCKLSSGYWQLFDPNNGYTAIHASILKMIPLEKINPGYFFESDMLFRLNTLRAVVQDIPITSVYKNESSSMNILRELFVFGFNHIKNFFKRIFYNYFLRDFSVASIEWVLGPALILSGFYIGVDKWIESVEMGISATAGTVMLAALPIIMGLQLLLSALNFDIFNQPSKPLHTIL